MMPMGDAGLGMGMGMTGGGFSGFDWRRMTDPNALWTFLEQTVRLSLVSRINTGNWYTDVLAAMACFYAIGLVLNGWGKIKPHLWKVTRVEPWLWLFAKIFCFLFRGTRVADKISIRFQQTDVLERTVSLVTSERTINSLFDPMSALCAELLAKYREEQRSLGKTTDGLGELIVRENEREPAIIPQSGTAQEFRFNDVLFEYVRTSPLITIYGDRDRQRENHTIKLTCRVPRASGGDPFKPLVDEAFRRAAERKQSTNWSQKLFRNGPDGKWIEADPPGARQLDTVVLRGNLRERIVNDIDKFTANEQFYHDVGIPFTRRYLFAGLPRSGKTSLIKALATAKKRHIHYLSLSTVTSDDQLMELMSPKNVKYRETLMVIEDIDCACEAVLDRQLLDAQNDALLRNKQDKDASIFGGDRNFARRKGAVDWTHDPADARTSTAEDKEDRKPKGITLAGLLNVLDGVVCTDGQILIATTNHPQRLDSALVQPGRFHCRFDFELADQDQFRRLFELFFKRPVAAKHVDRFKPDVVSPAEICNQFLGSLEDPDAAADRIVEISHRGPGANAFNAPVIGFSLLPSLPPSAPAPAASAPKPAEETSPTLTFQASSFVPLMPSIN